jgi:thymidylate kinase
MRTRPSTDTVRTPGLGDLAVSIVDAALDRPVLMTSAWPPAGRDLDLLCRERERTAVRAALARAGFLERGRLAPRRVHTEQWLLLRGAASLAVDLNPVARYGLPDEEVEALYADAWPGPGSRIGIPAPHHRVLLAARRLVNGMPAPGRLERTRSALAAQPDALGRARERAPAWGTESALDVLERILAGGPGPSFAERLHIRRELLAARKDPMQAARDALRAGRRRLPSHTSVIAISGLDGAGKSTQVRALEQTLTAAGVSAVVCWQPLGHSRMVRVVRRAAKRALGRSGSGPGAPPDGPPARTWDANPRTRQLRERSSAATQLWATYVAAVTSAGYRLMALRHTGRGRVLIFDRHALDTAAQLEYFYGRGDALPMQAAIIRRITPRPAWACFVDVPADVALERKPLQYDLTELERMAACYRAHAREMGIPTMDGTEPIDVLSERIAMSAWRAVAG